MKFNKKSEKSKKNRLRLVQNLDKENEILLFSFVNNIMIISKLKNILLSNFIQLPVTWFLFNSTNSARYITHNITLGKNLGRSSFWQHSSAADTPLAHTYSCWFQTRIAVCAGRELITLTHRRSPSTVPRISLPDWPDLQAKRTVERKEILRRKRMDGVQGYFYENVLRCIFTSHI